MSVRGVHCADPSYPTRRPESQDIAGRVEPGDSSASLVVPADDHFGLTGASWHIPDVVDSSFARDEVRKVEIMGVSGSF